MVWKGAYIVFMTHKGCIGFDGIEEICSKRYSAQGTKRRKIEQYIEK
jgi:hypothetical protein